MTVQRCSELFGADVRFVGFGTVSQTSIRKPLTINTGTVQKSVSVPNLRFNGDRGESRGNGELWSSATEKVEQPVDSEVRVGARKSSDCQCPMWNVEVFSFNRVFPCFPHKGKAAAPINGIGARPCAARNSVMRPAKVMRVASEPLCADSESRLASRKARPRPVLPSSGKNWAWPRVRSGSSRNLYSYFN
jgi:hypothetical protein